MNVKVGKKIESADKPGSVLDNHSSRRNVTVTLKQPTRIQREARQRDSYLVLLQVGFTLPSRVATDAVRSYHTLSPLPASRRSALCCTFRRLAPPRNYLAPCLEEPGLSSPVNNSSDCLANSPTVSMLTKGSSIGDREFVLRFQ